MSIVCLLRNKLAGVFNFKRFMGIYPSKYWVSMYIYKGKLIQNAYQEHFYLFVSAFFLSKHSRFQQSWCQDFPSPTRRLENSNCSIVCCYLYAVSLIFYYFFLTLFILEWTTSGDGELPITGWGTRPLLQKGLKQFGCRFRSNNF